MAGYQTGAANRISNDGTWTYTYDNAGNLTQQSMGATATTVYYGYDLNSRLTSVRQTSNGTTNTSTATYTYDVLGRLVQEDDWQTGGSVTTTRYAADDRGNVWADLSNTNVVQARYVNGDGVNQHVAVIDANGLQWYQTDHLGSVRDVFNGSGVTDHVEYAAFGAVASETTSGVGGAWRYTGERENLWAGIVFAGIRDELVKTGQWMQEDPIFILAGDGNFRRDVGNDPVNRIDPSGLFGEDPVPPPSYYEPGRWHKTTGESPAEMFRRDLERQGRGRLEDLYKLRAAETGDPEFKMSVGQTPTWNPAGKNKYGEFKFLFRGNPNGKAMLFGITFTPTNVVEKETIAFIQVVRTTVYQGNMKGNILDSDRPSDKEGWHVDNKPGQPFGWYGFFKKDGFPDGYADRLTTGVQPYVPGKTKEAALIDNPEPNGADRQQVFITAAVIKGGANDGKILGCIVFGQRTDNNGNWNQQLLLPP
jgi:RHS repeat-associated protein